VEHDTFLAFEAVNAKLDAILVGVNQLGGKTMAGIDQLRAEVERNSSVTQSIVTLVQGMSAEMRANAGNEQAILDLADRLDANNDAIADAVTANTPQADTGATGTGDTGAGGGGTGAGGAGAGGTGTGGGTTPDSVTGPVPGPTA
jgi:hypothetical protein